MAKQLLGRVAMDFKGEFNSSVTYEKLDVVVYEGCSYCALKETKGNLPTNEDFFALLVRKPISGIDYFTEEEKEEFVSKITADANSLFNQNVDSKTKEFNTNHQDKISDFNDNYDSKVKKFDDNVTNQTTTFNENVVEKQKEFDDNITNQTETFNTNATNKINEYNTNANNKVEEFNANAVEKTNEFNSTANAQKITSLSNEFYRVKDEVLETGEISDTFIHLEDSSMSELQELEIEGVCEQKTTEGNQLLELTEEKCTNNQFFSLVDGRVKIDTTSVNENVNFVKLFKDNLNIDIGEYTLFLKTVEGEYKGGNLIVYDSDMKDIKQTIITKDLKVVNFNNNSFGNMEFYLTYPNVKCVIEFMLVKGTKNGNDYFFEPFTGKNASPNPEYPQEIKTITDNFNLISCSKNLTYSWYSPKSKEQYIRNLFAKFPLKPNTTYTISIKDNNFSDSDFYSNEAIFESKIFASNNGRLYLTVKSVDEDTLKLAKENIYEYNENGWAILKNYKKFESNPIFEDVQIVEGNSIDFEGELYTQITTKLPDGEFIGKLDDTYRDILRVEYCQEDGKYHLELDKNVGKKVFSVSDNWNRVNNNVSVRFSVGGAEYAKNGNYETDIPMFKSNYFQPNNFSNIYLKDQSGVSWWFNDTKTNWVLSFGDDMSLEDFRTFLSNHTVETYYPLSAPYTIDLGPVEMPLSYNEITNIFTDNDLLPRINAKYYRNFKKTVKNLQVNNDALKNELISIENRLTALENANTSTVDVDESGVTE